MPTDFINRLLLFATFLLAFSLVDASDYQVAGFNDSKRVIDFVLDLQRSVKSNDVQHIAGLIRYPLFVDLHGQRVAIVNQRQFIKNYPFIFDATVRSAIVNANPKSLFANSKGIMLGRGALWFASLSSAKQVKTLIIRINNDSPKDNTLLK